MASEGISPFLHSWRPALREPAADVMSSYQLAAARAIETIQNSGWISGGIEQAIASTIGTGLRLAAKPDEKALGWSPDMASEWARQVESRWENYANRPTECDVRGESTLGKLTAQALRSYFAYGEITAALPYRRRPGGQYGTKLQMISPPRLTQEIIPPNLFYGVRRDDVGFPLAYRIRSPVDGYTPYEVREIPARDGYGRPQFMLVFDGVVGQPRGISPMVAVLKVLRQYEQLSDATLTQALIQAIFAASIKSPDPTEVTLQAFQEFAEQQLAKDKTGGQPPTSIEALFELRGGYYEGTKIDLERHGKIAHLAPGDELTFHGNMTPNAIYESFVRVLLREIARALGVTFEEMTGDFSNATYSSVRMATSTIWGIVQYRRANLLGPLLSGVYEAWLGRRSTTGGRRSPVA